MPQVPAIIWAQGDLIDYAPAGAVSAGDVIVINGVVYVSPLDIPAGTLGMLNVRSAIKAPKKTGIITAGDSIYWDPAGSPNTGTASSGAAFNTAVGTLMGTAIATTLSADDYVYVSRVGPRGPTTFRETINADVAATGSIQGDAAAVLEGFTAVTGADGTKGVILPTAVPGATIEIKNVTAAILKVWPAVGAQVNAGGANAFFSVPASTVVILKAKTAILWYSIPLVPS